MAAICGKGGQRMHSPRDAVQAYAEKAIEGIRVVENALNDLEFRKETHTQIDKEAIYQARRNLKAVHLLIGVLIISDEKPVFNA
jgi:hypothetical protein